MALDIFPMGDQIDLADQGSDRSSDKNIKDYFDSNRCDFRVYSALTLVLCTL